MLDRLLQLLSVPPAAPADTVGAPFPRQQLAVAALLIELAQSDRRLRHDELATVAGLVRDRFGLDPAHAGRLLAAAKREFDASLEDWVFAQAVREGFTAEERAGIVALLWEVVYADGRLAVLEEALIRRLASELAVGEDECEAARAQAFARHATQRSTDTE